MLSNLRPDEVLYFLHIPKTAGGSLILTLDSHFTEDEIIPALLLSDLVQIPNLLERLDQCRFIRGHFDALILSLIRRPVRVITLLRDPVDRTLSHFCHLQSHRATRYFMDEPGEQAVETLNRFLQSDWAERVLGNVQLRALTSEWRPMTDAANWDTATPVMPPATRLAIARQRLDHCLVVGIQERWSDFVQLLSYTLGLRLTPCIARCNENPNRISQDEISEFERNRLCELNTYDEVLYQAACQRFAADYARMCSELDAKYPEYQGQLDAQISLHHDQQRSVAATLSVLPTLPDGTGTPVVYRFNESLIGTNWYQRERHLDQTFRWTGPDKCSQLEMRVFPHNAYHVVIETLGAVTLEALESFRFKVNGIEIPLGREPGIYGPKFVGFVPSDRLKPTGEQILQFLVDNPVTLAGRTLGVSVVRVEFLPSAPHQQAA